MNDRPCNCGAGDRVAHDPRCYAASPSSCQPLRFPPIPPPTFDEKRNTPWEDKLGELAQNHEESGGLDDAVAALLAISTSRVWCESQFRAALHCVLCWDDDEIDEAVAEVKARIEAGGAL